MDANPPERQGETFGLYGAAQMGGLMVGPAIGGLAAAATHQPTIVFWVAGVALVASALLVALRVHELPRGVHTARIVGRFGRGVRGGFETRPYKKSRSIATSGLSAGGIS